LRAAREAANPNGRPRAQREFSKKSVALLMAENLSGVFSLPASSSAFSFS